MRRSYWVALILALLVAPSAYVAWVGRDEPHFGQGHDDSIYFVTAKAIAAGHGYRIESLPDEPWQTKYPPLLPLYLSNVWRLAPRFPQNLQLATLFMWVWLPVWVALSYRVFRDLGLDWRVALGLCGAVALNQQSVHFSIRTQPELMFAALWTASAAIVVSGRKSAYAVVAAGLLGGVAYLTKTAALPLIVAAPICYAARGRLRSGAIFVCAMLPPVVGWNLWMRAHFVRYSDPLHMYYTDYLGYHLYTIRLAGYGRILAKNLDSLLGAAGGLLLDWSEAPGLTERVLAVFIFAGVIWHFRRVRLNPYHLFAGGYILLLIVWHYPPDVRFLLPILPILLAGLWTELATGFRALQGRRVVAMALTAAVAGVVLFFGVQGWRGLMQSFPWFRDIQAANYLPAYDWIVRHTPPDRAILASEDVELYLYTGRKAISPIPPMGFFYSADVDGITRFVLSRPEIARREGMSYIFDCPRDFRREFLPSGLDLPALSHRRLAASPEVRKVWSGGASAIYEVF